MTGYIIAIVLYLAGCLMAGMLLFEWEVEGRWRAWVASLLWPMTLAAAIGWAAIERLRP